MGTNIRPEVKPKSPYWISRHRYYELYHFCKQYPDWKKAYADLCDISVSSGIKPRLKTGKVGDPVSHLAEARLYYSRRIDMVEKAAYEADKEIGSYILKAVTEGRSYTYLKARLNIPCSRDTYYGLYRRFFWLLSNSRN